MLEMVLPTLTSRCSLGYETLEYSFHAISLRSSLQAVLREPILPLSPFLLNTGASGLSLPCPGLGKPETLDETCFLPCYLE